MDSGTGCMAKQVAEIPDLTKRIDSAMNELASMIERVQDQLAPVMRAAPPLNRTDVAAPPTPESPLGAWMRTTEDGLLSALSRIRDIDRRLVL